jgi:hypothetical protein
MQENSAKHDINYVSNPKERRKKVYIINSKIKSQNYKAWVKQLTIIRR